MKLEEIKKAVDAGKTVHWCNTGYEVLKDCYSNYYIVYTLNDSAVGLCRRDNGKLIEDEIDFFLG